jgi:hypothetical protein
MEHKEVLKLIEEMSNVERNKLLENLFYKYFDSRPSKEVMDEEREKAKWGD